MFLWMAIALIALALNPGPPPSLLFAVMMIFVLAYTGRQVVTDCKAGQYRTLYRHVLFGLALLGGWIYVYVTYPRL